MKSSTKYGVFLICMFSLLMLGIFMSNFSSDSLKTLEQASDSNIIRADNISNNLNKPITIERSSLLEKYTHEDLNNYSDTVVIGTVKEILPPKWNTIDGKMPDKTAAELTSSDLIYTDIIITVDKYIKNPLSSNEVTIRVIGGTLGNVTMSSDEEPNFKLGEKVLLYLTKDTHPDIKNIRPEHFVATGFKQGKYTLTEDGKAMTPYEIINQEELLNTIENKSSV